VLLLYRLLEPTILLLIKRTLSLLSLIQPVQLAVTANLSFVVKIIIDELILALITITSS